MALSIDPTTGKVTWVPDASPPSPTIADVNSGKVSPDQYTAAAIAAQNAQPQANNTAVPSWMGGSAPDQAPVNIPAIVNPNPGHNAAPVNPVSGDMQANPVPNPMSNPALSGNVSGTTKNLDPTALLKAMGTASGKAPTNGATAIDNYLKSLTGHQSDREKATDAMKTANLLAASGTIAKNDYLGTNLANADADVNSKLDSEYAKWDSANQQSQKIRDDSLKQIQALKDQQIDPQRLWHNLNTGQKIASVISVVLGGFANGFSGGKVANTGLEQINNMIHQDNEAQLTALQNKRQSITDQMKLQQSGFDQDTALHASRIQGLMQRRALVQDMIKNHAMKYDNPVVQAAAEQANAQLDKDNANDQDKLSGVIYQAQSAKERAQAAQAAAQVANVQKIKDKAAELVDKGMQPEEAMRTSIYLNTGMNTDPNKPLASVTAPFEKANSSTKNIPMVMTMPDGTQKTVVARDENEFKQFQSVNTLNNLARNVKSTSGNPFASGGSLGNAFRAVQGTDANHNLMAQQQWNAQIMAMVHNNNPAARSVEALQLIGAPYLVQKGDSQETIDRKVQAAQRDFGNTDLPASDKSDSTSDDANQAGYKAIR